MKSKIPSLVHYPLNEPHCIIRVSADKLSADICLRKKGDDETGCPLNPEDVHKLLSSMGIVSGINHESIDNALRHFQQHPDGTESFNIARGTPATGHALPVKLLFLQKQPTSGQERGEPSILTPLIRTGAQLAIPCEAEFDQKGKDIFGKSLASQKGPGIRVRAGCNVEYHKKSDSYTAMVSGYPAAEHIQENDQAFLELSVTELVQVSPDGMSARLTLRPSPPGFPSPEFATLLDVLDEEKIIFGRQENQLLACLEDALNEQKAAEVTAAIGLRPMDGTDAKLKFEIEVGPLPGKIRSDGSIDFRERKMFVAVSKGELIAIKIPLTEGTPGKDVRGVEVPQKPGKDISLKVTDDAIFDPDTGEVRAARSGVLSMVSENSVKVCAKQVVSGDVDFNTGNIISRDTLEISGSVRPQFKVIAFGDITIGGNVEKATLRSDANIIIKGGLLGQGARIEARGDVDVRFVEHARIFAHGNIVLRTSGYYCRLHSWNDLFAPPGVKVIASQVVAAGSLTLGDVGAEHADHAVLAASVDPERLQLYYDYQRTCREKQVLVDQTRQLVGSDSENETLKTLQQELRWAEDALRTLNMIPGTLLAENPKGTVHLPQQQIIVHGTIFNGTEIRIGNTTTVLADTMTKVRFYLEYEKSGKGQLQPSIVSAPLEEEKK